MWRQFLSFTPRQYLLNQKDTNPYYTRLLSRKNSLHFFANKQAFEIVNAADGFAFNGKNITNMLY